MSQSVGMARSCDVVTNDAVFIVGDNATYSSEKSSPLRLHLLHRRDQVSHIVNKTISNLKLELKV